MQSGIIHSMKELAQQAQVLLGLRLNSAQLRALEKYENELIAWNERFNLTAIDTPEKIRTKHFLDSFTCLLVMRDSSIENVIDVGSGAGFPGIPLKIAFPVIQMTIVESVGKKADFCRHIIKILGIDGIEVVQERAEFIGTLALYRQQYDWAVARSVARLPVLIEYLLPLVRVGGRILAMKGENGPAEAQAAEHAMHILGGRLRIITPVSLPGVEDQRYLVVADKIAATPDQYPRRVGEPAKHPLS